MIPDDVREARDQARRERHESLVLRFAEPVPSTPRADGTPVNEYRLDVLDPETGDATFFILRLLVEPGRPEEQRKEIADVLLRTRSCEWVDQRDHRRHEPGPHPECCWICEEAILDLEISEQEP